MVKPLSEQILGRKRERTRVAAREQMVATGGPDVMFSAFRNRPTATQFEDMVLAAKFGPDDPLTPGGDGFAVEYILDELDKTIAAGKARALERPPKIVDPDAHSIRIVSSQTEVWGNLLFVFDIDETLYPFWPGGFRIDDFDTVANAVGGIEYLIEKESRSFGVSLACEVQRPIAEAMRELDPDGNLAPVRSDTPFKANDRCTVYWIVVGPLDRLMSEEERARHGVIAHERHLQSGRIVMVKGHQRTNPRRLRSRKTNRDEIANIVYRVFDADGVVRYYGEGKRTRPEHVNSGVSHNFKINEHFFTRGPMRVEVVREHLSKDEALAVERLLIRGHKASHLWNVKDYEPLGVPEEV